MRTADLKALKWPIPEGERGVGLNLLKQLKAKKYHFPDDETLPSLL